MGFIPEVVSVPTKTVEIDLSDIKEPIYLTTLNDKKLDSLDVSFTAGEYLAASQLIVKNNANIDLHKVTYSFNGDVIDMFEIVPLKQDLIAANEYKIIQLGLNKSYKFVPGLFGGSFVVKSKEGAGLNLPINIKVLGIPEVLQENKTDGTIVNKSTRQLVQEEKGVNPFLILFVIVLFLLIILFFIYRRTKPKQREFEAFVEKIKRS